MAAASRITPSLRSMLVTTVACRCPVCGEGRMFRTVFQLKDCCEVCGARFERGRGEWTGPVVIGYTLGAGLAFFLWVYLFATGRLFPGVEWVMGALAIVISLGTYRNAKAWWIWLLDVSGLVYPDQADKKV